MPKYRCEDCDNQVEAPEEPKHCPCGSENIEEVTNEGIIQEIKDTLRL